MATKVDVVLLTRDNSPVQPQVGRAVAKQRGVQLEVHRLVGHSRPTDRTRWETIARARNIGKKLGTSDWLMFLDDDVVLADSCVSRLLQILRNQASCGALAADYLGEYRTIAWDGHVAMGATLFRRAALDQIQFRWEPRRCECQCCCNDLRALGWQIGYSPSARAMHLEQPSPVVHATADSDSECMDKSNSPILEGRVLVAFDRLHYRRFCGQFLTSLRAAGNAEQVTIVGYGLYPSQVRALRRWENVEVLPIPSDRREVPVRRLEDFQTAIANWHPETPVAYWDAGDVIIQSKLDPLWNHVRSHPDKILAAREPMGHPENRAVASWTLSIRDDESRRRAFNLLSKRPFLNSGFAAGTVKSLAKYLRTAHRLRNSPALIGSSDWGDQTAFNLYCHSNPDAWHEVDETWNYCLYARRRGEIVINHSGQAQRHDGVLIHAVHGTANTLRGYPVRYRVS